MPALLPQQGREGEIAPAPQRAESSAGLLLGECGSEASYDDRASLSGASATSRSSAPLLVFAKEEYRGGWRAGGWDLRVGLGE